MEPILDEKINKNSTNYQPCYHCRTTNYNKVTYSLWGGWIGPKLLHHVKCLTCGKHYNGKTGTSNTKKILIYSLFTLGIALALLLTFLRL